MFSFFLKKNSLDRSSQQEDFFKVGFLISCFLVLSWLLPISGAIWDYIDEHLYLYLNYQLSILPNYVIQLCAFLNSRFGDWTSQLFFLTFFGWCIFKNKNRKQASLTILKFIIFIIFVQILINKTLLPRVLQIHRSSPTLSLPLFINLEHSFPLPNNHITSLRSFPADHATTLFLLFAFSLRITNFKYFFPLVSIVIIFSLPRVICGAHWLTDVAIGAGSISILGFCLGNYLFHQQLSNLKENSLL